MFSDIGEFTGVGALMNPAAISLLRTNAVNAGRQVLGPATPVETLIKAANNYVAMVQPRTNRALTAFEIAHDINFTRIAKAAKESATAAKESKDNPLVEVSDYGLMGSVFGGIPNYLLYGAVAGAGYWWWRKKHKKGKTKTRKARTTKRSIAASTIPPSLGGE